MYQRIMNNLDLSLLKKELLDKNDDKRFITDRMEELISVLCESYGVDRTSFAMGGYVLYFNTVQEYLDTKKEILDFYKLEDDDHEYEDVIGIDENNKTKWKERLYLLSSDDSLVFIFPEED